MVKPRSKIGEIRQAVADYIGSEGCSCCEGSKHAEHAERLGKLLGILKYPDGSGRDFSRYQTKEDSGT